MKATLFTILLALLALAATAQEWNQPWISHPTADSTAQIWFKKTFELSERLQTADIYVASNGRFIVYVNGYNVSADVLEPFCTGAMMRYNANRFLRKGANTVAVWYSPMPPCRQTNEQIALTVCGTDAHGHPFATATDGTWLCRQANATTTVYGDETVEANHYVPDWNIGEESIVGWLAAKEHIGGRTASQVPLWHDAMHISRIDNYAYFDETADGIVYHFKNHFDGWVRLTLRNMQRGDTISVNGLRYVCSGEDDEQACRRFTTSLSNIAVVKASRRLSRDNVTNIEAITIEPYLHKSYSY